jgi:hypothetical protein
LQEVSLQGFQKKAREKINRLQQPPLWAKNTPPTLPSSWKIPSGFAIASLGIT